MRGAKQIQQIMAIEAEVKQAQLCLQPAGLQAAIKQLAALRSPAIADITTGIIKAVTALPPTVTPQQFGEICTLCLDLLATAKAKLEALPPRKQVMVFLPYKASMWDSLESIWQAASQDKEHCEAIVMPIPYCDLTPERTVKEWHYEGPLFPPYVPITHYDSLDLAQLHPDVIFIHNPYDGYNRITSVDNRFYSDRLKQYTDKLVYVPYFVVDSNVAPHFVQTPGVLNADYVIVQDETIREQYEEFYPGGKPPAGKILGLGSPKFDKVQHTTRADYTLPPEWERLIKGRKIVLYNTSLTTMLNYTSFFCRKLREVFAFFRQRQDVVLWWRPHPLLRATFESMRPEYYDKYCALEQQYRDEDWGIYDDTADVDRAVVCSDAYYGDLASSLVWLYHVTGKPLLFQDVLGVYFGAYHFYDFAEAVDGAWLLRPFLRHGLLRAEPRTGQMSLVTDVRQPNVPMEAALSNAYFASQQVGNQYFLLPWADCDLCVYDMQTHSCQHVDLGQQGLRSRLYIVGARAYAGRLYCWGYTYGIIEYDIASQRVVATYPLAEVQPGDMGVYSIFNVATVVSTRLYLAHKQRNSFFWFDFVSKDSGSCEAGKPDMCFAALTAAGGQLWLVGRAPSLVRYDLQTGRWEQYNLPVPCSQVTGPYFINIFQQDSQLLLLPCCECGGADAVIRYDLATGHMQIAHHAGGYSQALQLRDGSVAAQDMQRMQVDLYAPDGTVREVQLHPDSQLQQEWQDNYQQGDIRQFCERYDMPLPTFIQQLAHQATVIQQPAETAGGKIYAAMMR